MKWLPSFLHLFADWLEQHQNEMDRSEAISLYLAYDFNHFYESDYPKPEGLIPFHQQVLILAGRYEKDLIFHARMIPIKRQHPPKTSETRQTVIALCILVLPLLLLCIAVRITSTDPEMNGYHYDHSDWYPTEHSAGIWSADNFFTMAFPAGYPTSVPEPISETSAMGKVPQIILSYLAEHGHPEADITCLQNISQQRPGIFQITLPAMDDVTYTLYVESLAGQPAYGHIVASTYYPELFLHFSRQHDLVGNIWTDSQNQVHAAMAYAAPIRKKSLNEALLSTYKDFYRYHHKIEPDAEVPPINITTTPDMLGAKWIENYKNNLDVDFSHTSWYYITITGDSITPLYHSYGDQRSRGRSN